MVLFPKNKSEINLGEIEEQKTKSVNDKQARKKYTGEFRVLLPTIVVMMSRFPTTIKM